MSAEPTQIQQDRVSSSQGRSLTQYSAGQSGSAVTRESCQRSTPLGDPIGDGRQYHHHSSTTKRVTWLDRKRCRSDVKDWRVMRPNGTTANHSTPKKSRTTNADIINLSDVPMTINSDILELSPSHANILHSTTEQNNNPDNSVLLSSHRDDVGDQAYRLPGNLQPRDRGNYTYLSAEPIQRQQDYVSSLQGKSLTQVGAVQSGSAVTRETHQRSTPLGDAVHTPDGNPDRSTQRRLDPDGYVEVDTNPNSAAPFVCQGRASAKIDHPSTQTTQAQ
ncbi:hypothetical protein DPMN_002847 [Dreissena polymorpha]|uniref:Uncharacterized protein n=1 Tax=Dreissena polymorpha TaxID=45954 RepID=A0A9D4MMD8_DREPO|nr:hypothetical protein DPMN_002847 [Dreissena polymorpha]